MDTSSTPTELALWVVISANTKWPGDPLIAGLSHSLGRVVIKPPATHVYGVLREPSGDGYAIEAVPHTGVRLFDPSEKDHQRLRWYRVPATQDQIRAIWGEARAHLNRPYDWTGLLLTFVFILLRKPGWWYIKRAQIYCSALWAWCLRTHGFDLLPRDHIDNIYPSLWESAMLAAGWACDAPDFAVRY